MRRLSRSCRKGHSYDLTPAHHRWPDGTRRCAVCDEARLEKQRATWAALPLEARRARSFAYRKNAWLIAREVRSRESSFEKRAREDAWLAPPITLEVPFPVYPLPSGNASPAPHSEFCAECSASTFVAYFERRREKIHSELAQIARATGIPAWTAWGRMPREGAGRLRLVRVRAVPP